MCNQDHSSRHRVANGQRVEEEEEPSYDAAGMQVANISKLLGSTVHALPFGSVDPCFPDAVVTMG